MSNFLMKHGTGWKYVRAIPKDLRDVFGGRQNRTRYIGIMSWDDAKGQALLFAAEDTKIMDGVRRLSPAERAAIAKAEVIGSSAPKMIEGKLTATKKPTILRGYDAWKLQSGVAPQSLSFLEIGTDAKPDPHAPEAEQAYQALEMIRAQEAYKRAQENIRRAGKIARTIDAKPDGSAMLSLVDLYAHVRAPGQKVQQKMRLYTGRFIEAVGDLAPGEVRAEHVSAFRQWLEDRGDSYTNIVQHLDKINTLFRVAKSEGRIDFNPADGIKARKQPGAKRSDRRQPFLAAHVRAMFNALKDESEDFTWVTRLLAYHGARSGEICQLRCDDVSMLHGVDVLRIHDQHGSVKNNPSVRDIPIHRKCRGITAYARKIAAKHGADAWLFQSYDAPKAHGRGHKFQNYGNDVFLRKTLKITDKRLTMHSLRHTWRTLAREVGMPEPVSRAIMGHTLGSGEHGAYGGVLSLKLRAKWIGKIDPLA